MSDHIVLILKSGDKQYVEKSDCISFLTYYIEMITCYTLQCALQYTILWNYLVIIKEEPNTSDLMSNAAGTCSRTWDRIGPKVTSLHTPISPVFSKNVVKYWVSWELHVYIQNTK